ncbi:hypothetical protein ColTof4_14020 [Colletotrichum tofieldiae]|nr:hypothetical protein ColTof3_14654 [Colletotrichum tofieldiae]GKT81597.1 hypothetical protein ColTof4_14020 [Colletotrichum tofieldiae]
MNALGVAAADAMRACGMASAGILSDVNRPPVIEISRTFYTADIASEVAALKGEAEEMRQLAQRVVQRRAARDANADIRPPAMGRAQNTNDMGSAQRDHKERRWWPTGTQGFKAEENGPVEPLDDEEERLLERVRTGVLYRQQTAAERFITAFGLRSPAVSSTTTAQTPRQTNKMDGEFYSATNRNLY